MPGRGSSSRRSFASPIWGRCARGTSKASWRPFNRSWKKWAGNAMKALILAAGVGKRLWQLTQHRPKCLIEIGGRTLLDRYFRELTAVGIREATLVVGYKQEMIRAAAGSGLHGVAADYLV